MTHRWILALGACGLLACAPALATPDALWGYVDGAGVAHFGQSQIDSRYSAVMGDVDLHRVPGKTDASGKLMTWLEIAPEVKSVQHLVREAAAATGVDAELLQAVIAVESGFKRNAVSPRGAIGLMQLMPDTADRYATKAEAARPASERLLDPRMNILTGARMLADLTRRMGGVDVALAAWNAGEGTVRRAGGVMPPIDETRAHVHQVLELYWALMQRSLQQQTQAMQLHR